MRAALAKSLDRSVIQLARRHVRKQESRAPVDADEIWRQTTDLLKYSPTPAIECQVDADGRFQFTSAVASSFPENNQVRGRIFYAGQDWTKRPAVILLHGWNAGLCYRYFFPYLAAGLRHFHVSTAIFELPYHMHRRPRTGPNRDFISGDVRQTLEATRQALSDTRALTCWLQRQGCPAVGLWGFSLGAWLGGLAAGQGPRLRFAVFTTPIVRIDRVVAELPFSEPIRRSLQNRTASLQGLNLNAQPPPMDPAGILLMASQYDLFAPAETVEELWRAWDQPEIWRLAHGHISVLGSLPILHRATRWIARNTAGFGGA